MPKLKKIKQFFFFLLEVNIIAETVAQARAQWYSDDSEVDLVGGDRPPEELLEARAQDVEGVTVLLDPPDFRRKLQPGRIVSYKSAIWKRV